MTPQEKKLIAAFNRFKKRHFKGQATISGVEHEECRQLFLKQQRKQK